MEKEKNIYQKLTEIQNELKVPKDQNNDFGGYKYRSAEDIQEKVKPLLLKHGVALFASDSIESVEGRHYVKATLTLTDGVGNIQVSAFAREPLEVKKQAEAQTTGSSSSYARKYALAGLFQLDDTKDPDATNDHGKGVNSAEQAQAQALRAKAQAKPQGAAQGATGTRRTPARQKAAEPVKTQQTATQGATEEQTAPIDLQTAGQMKVIQSLFDKLPEKTKLMTLDAYGIEKIEDLPKTDWEKAIDGLTKWVNEH